MGFRFRFQTVLAMRERQEDERRNELALEERRLAEKTAELNAWDEARRQGIDTFYQACNGVIDIEYLSRCQSHLSFLKERRDDCRQALEGIHDDVEQARKRLIEARKERKAMEQLKEKKHQAYIKEEQAKEQKFLDDIGLSVFSRKPR
jgi:flagellar FliJ protein